MNDITSEVWIHRPLEFDIKVSSVAVKLMIIEVERNRIESISWQIMSSSDRAFFTGKIGNPVVFFYMILAVIFGAHMLTWNECWWKGKTRRARLVIIKWITSLSPKTRYSDELSITLSWLDRHLSFVDFIAMADQLRCWAVWGLHLPIFL